MVYFNPDKPTRNIGIEKGSDGGNRIIQKQVSFDDFREAVKKLNAKSADIDISKLETIDIDNLDDNTTSVTDKNGNLKSEVSAGVALNDDGTLKPGWSVGADGVPRFSRMKQFEESARTGKNPGFDYDPSERDENGNRIMDDPFHPGKKMRILDDPGFDTGNQDPLHPKAEDSGFDRPMYGTKTTPTYEVKDGKLVQNGQKIEVDKSIIFY